MKIVSGKTGTSHVTSEQFRQIIEGTVGQGSYILTSGENLEPELASNNMLKIRGGMMSHHGNVSCVELNTYDEVTLTNGSQGVKRIDLIVNRYTRNDETGLEKNEWVVIIGTPDATNPKVPEYIAGNLQNGDLTDDCPVFEVHYDGINVTEVKKLLPVMSNLDLLNGNLLELQSYHDKKTLASTDLGIMGGVWKAVVNNSCIIGKTVHLNMEIYTTATIVANNVYDNVFTIPSQYRPLNDTVVNVIASDGSYKNPVACTSMVMTNGNLFICIPKSTNNYLFIDAEWEIKYTKQQL